jgi:SOS-response transcriptional repressor LexA|tara:strand:- start:258 stop:656 length:399 start_codon:yes stop_codon:yes gene_type:complete
MAKAGLTIKQKKVYDFIRMWIKEKGDSPSFEEISLSLGIKSKSAISSYLNKLEQRGYITRIPHASRSITIVGDDKPELNKLKNIAAHARIYFNAKSAWDEQYALDPEHSDNQNVHAPRVLQTHNDLKKLVMD